MGGIYRAGKDRWAFGVCGGIAHSYGWSPNVLRLLTIVVAIAIPGFSVIPTIIAYLILATVLPVSNEF